MESPGLLEWTSIILTANPIAHQIIGESQTTTVTSIILTANSIKRIILLESPGLV